MGSSVEGLAGGYPAKPASTAGQRSQSRPDVMCLLLGGMKSRQTLATPVHEDPVALAADLSEASHRAARPIGNETEAGLLP